MKRFALPTCPIVLGILIFGRPAPASARSAAAVRIREPAVAGIFHPADPEELARTVDRLIAAARTERTGELKALICPHAGYPFSGSVAASGFRLLRGAHYETVVVMEPAHFAALDAGSVSNATAYRTPLGDVPVSPKARNLAGIPPFALNPPYPVEPPEWAPATSRTGPIVTGHAGTWEHSVEVELPFLQRTLAAPFQVVPVVIRRVDPRRAATTLKRILDDKSDFLDSLSEKAGGRADDWRQAGTKAEIHRVQSFEEPGR